MASKCSRYTVTLLHPFPFSKFLSTVVWRCYSSNEIDKVALNLLNSVRVAERCVECDHQVGLDWSWSNFSTSKAISSDLCTDASSTVPSVEHFSF